MWKDIKKTCLNCEKNLVLRASRDVQRKKFCSKSCNCSYYSKIRMQNPEFKKKIFEASHTPEANKKKSNKKEKNPRWKGGKILKNCIICNKEFYVSRYRDAEGYGIYCSKECFKKIQVKPRIKKNCLQCGKVFELLEKRAIRAKFCSQKCRAVYCRSHIDKRINLIESKMEILLKELNIFYQIEKDVENMAVVDFLLPNKICIFCDGNYWHGQKNERDNFVNQYLENMGYIVLRFTEDEINLNPELVKEKLKKII